MRYHFSPQLKTFLLGLSISILFLSSFFAGALADRIFVIRPLDVITGRARVQNLQQAINQPSSNLGQLLTEGSSGVADVAEAVSPSVVTVSIKKQQRVVSNPQLDLFGWGPFFGMPGQSSRIEQIQQDIGTGFVVEGGLIVTNKHVVGDPEAEYLVIDKNDKEYRVSKMYRDPNNDLAIVRVEGMDLPALPLGNSDEIRVGESVIAIGTALGEFRHTVTTGVISGLGRGISATDGFGLESLEGVIQTDAAINPGNSGGPLISSAGQVIGVNVAVSAGAENIGFAIPINVVKASLANFNETGQFDRPFFGIRYQMISEQAALFNEVPQGAYVAEVVADSSAADAGLEPGDIVISFDGKKLKDQPLATLINQKKIGERVEVRYWRDGKESTVTVELKKSP